MWQILGVGIEGFVLPNPGWGVDRLNPFQPPTAEHRYPPAYDLFFPRRIAGCPRPESTLQINRPTAMPHQEFTDLTKEERRQLPHHHDKIIDVEGHPRLRVGFWQSRFKVADHGAIHGLPYSVKNNGGTKTEKSDDNALSMMQSIEDMPHRPNAIWFDQDDVTYQGGTDREFPAVYILDDDSKVVAIFNKQTGNFVTTCQLTEKEETDQMSVVDFFTKIIQEIDKKEKKIKLEKDVMQGGYILRTRNRRSNNYFRIYEKEVISLNFELEMKGSLIKRLTSLLVDNRFEEFEQKLSSHFLALFGKTFPIHYSYFDWLAIRLRPMNQNPLAKKSKGLNTDYLESEIVMEPEKFIQLIIFLNYAQNLDFEIEYLGSVAYRKVIFRIRDFIQFKNSKNDTPNYYQYRKVIEYLRDLQSGLHITKFKNKYYQSLVIVPQVEFEKHQKYTVAKVWLVEKLFYYDYPFYLPNLFHKLTKAYQKKVAVKLFEKMASESIEKIILMDEFYETYPSCLSNLDKSKIKKYFIECVSYLEEQGIIQSKYKYIYQGNFLDTKKLTPQLISEGFIIYERIHI